MSIYLVHTNNSQDPGYPYWNYGDAGKQRYDFEQFAREIGIEIISDFAYSWPDEPWVSLSARLDGIYGGLKKNDVVLIHYPVFHELKMTLESISRIHGFGAKVVFIVSDIAYWRLKTEDEMQALKEDEVRIVNEKELGVLSRADGFILHSIKMKDRLVSQFEMCGLKFSQPVSYIGPSGYIANHFSARRTYNGELDYAGSLHKAKFLIKVPEKINVFGVIQNEKSMFEENKNLILHGRMDPEAVPHFLNGSFGIVWDSDSYPKVTGALGDYERFNTPGKLPMYLGADEPVIVWEKAACAKYVSDNKVGIVLSDLGELHDKISNMGEREYDCIVKNVQRVSPLIRSGVYVKKAMLDISIKVSCS